MCVQGLWKVFGFAILAGLVTSRAMGQNVLPEPPQNADPSARFLFYLHGKIIEDRGLPATSPTFGQYEYRAILGALRDKGYTVISETRPKNTNPWAYAEIVAFQVRQLLEQGIPPGHITVAGASKGARIAVLVANELKNAEINVVLLAGCSPNAVANWRQNRVCLWGRVLSIYDESDTLAGSCDPFVETCSDNVATFKEVTLTLGLGHGFFYRPLDAWIDPIVAWTQP